MVPLQGHPEWQAASAAVAELLKRRIRNGTLSKPAAAMLYGQIGHESRFGAGYGPRGAGSNQLGSILGRGSAGTFLTKDSSPGQAARDRGFKKYKTLDEGLDDVIRITQGRDYETARQSGDPVQYAAALYNHGYYEGTEFDTRAGAPKNIATYANAMAQWREWGVRDGLDMTAFQANRTYTPVDAFAAWTALFGNAPMRRLRRAVPTKAATGRVTQNLAPQSEVPEASRPTPASPLPRANEVVALLTNVPIASRPPAYTTNVLDDGKIAPWRTIR